jgi:YHS domain-containing protein
MEIDRVCDGIGPRREVVVEHGGTTNVFCSKACRDDFADDPAADVA